MQLRLLFPNPYHKVGLLLPPVIENPAVPVREMQNGDSNKRNPFMDDAGPGSCSTANQKMNDPKNRFRFTRPKDSNAFLLTLRPLR